MERMGEKMDQGETIRLNHFKKTALRGTQIYIYRIWNEGALVKVHQKHFARLETALYLHFVVVQVGQHSNFRREQDTVVMGHVVTARPENGDDREGSEDEADKESKPNGKACSWIIG